MKTPSFNFVEEAQVDVLQAHRLDALFVSNYKPLTKSKRLMDALPKGIVWNRAGTTPEEEFVRRRMGEITDEWPPEPALQHAFQLQQMVQLTPLQYFGALMLRSHSTFAAALWSRI